MKVKNSDFRMVLGEAMAMNKPVVLDGHEYSVVWNGEECELGVETVL